MSRKVRNLSKKIAKVITTEPATKKEETKVNETDSIPDKLESIENELKVLRIIERRYQIRSEGWLHLTNFLKYAFLYWEIKVFYSVCVTFLKKQVKKTITYTLYEKINAKIGEIRLHQINKILGENNIEKIEKQSDITALINKLQEAKVNEELERFDKMLGAMLDNEEKHEWLRWLHQRYSERFLNDNNRIWTISSIFIPLSLAGLSSAKDGTLLSTCLLGIGSISLMVFWHVTCEKHRSFQEKAKEVVNRIERCIGLNVDLLSVPEPFPDIHLYEKGTWQLTRLPQYFINSTFKKSNIQVARRYMLYTVTLLWIAAISFAVYKEMNESEKELLDVRVKIIE